MWQITTGICDLVCSRCCLRRAFRRPPDRRISPGRTCKSVIKRTAKFEGLGNRRVIDFLKHSSSLVLPDLDLEAPSEGHLGAPSAQNNVIYNVLVQFCFNFVQKHCFLQHSVGRRACAGWGSEGAREACQVSAWGRILPGSWGRRVCVGWGSEGAREACKNERLRPDSAWELQVQGCAGSVHK